MSNELQTQDLLRLPTMQQLEALMRYGNLLVKSGLLPYSVNTPEKAIVIILKGRELGLPPMLALSQIVIINGKPAMQSELMLSLVYSKMPNAQIDFIRSDDKGCVIEAARNGTAKKMEIKFLNEDAIRAKLFEKSADKGKGPGPWLTYPTAMFRARAISSMCRVLFPDVILGVSYTPEELESEHEKLATSLKDVTQENPVAIQEPKDIDETIIETQKIKEQQEKEKKEIQLKIEVEKEREFKLKVWSEIKLVNEHLKHDLNKYFFSLFGKEIKDCTLVDFQEALSQLKILRGENGN